MKIQITTRQVAMVAIFAALYTVLRLIQTIPMVGVPGARFSVSDAVAPVIGILLGPYLGGLSVITGTFLAMAVGKPVVFLGLDFLPALVNVVALGFLVRRKWVPVVLLYVALLAIFLLNPYTSLFITVGNTSIPFAWLHIVGLAVLLSPLGYKAGRWVADIPEEGFRRETAAYLLSQISGIMGIAIGAFFLLITYLIPTFFFGTQLLGIVIGLLSIICGTIVIIAASKLNSDSANHKKWGKIILVTSVFGLGTLLGVIGGALALKYKPQNLPNQRTSFIKASKFTVGFISLAFVGTMIQHLTGNILYEFVFGKPIGGWGVADFATNWNIVFFVYPWERLVLVVLAVVIGIPLVRALKKFIFPSGKSTKPNTTL
jgi:hypothetical protein